LSLRSASIGVPDSSYFHHLVLPVSFMLGHEYALADPGMFNR
jgi:hypothetical protein